VFFFNSQVTNATKVCSLHFKPTDYKWTATGRKDLKRGTNGPVPSVFSWTNEKPPRRILKRKLPTPKMDRTENNDSDVPICLEPDQPPTDLPNPLPSIPFEDRIQNLEEKVRCLESQKKKLEEELHVEHFGIERFTSDDNNVQFYTGFPSYSSFIAFYRFCEPTAKNMTSKYYLNSSESMSLAGRPRCMLLIDELFMFLCRLRLGLLEQDLSIRFNCSVSTISRKIVTWVNFLYFVLGNINIWLPRDVIDRLMPQAFKDTYPSTRVIIDCTEIKTQRPSSLVIGSQLYSNYKSTNTFKALVGIAPHGAITFVSSLYTGCMSDNEITKLSGLLDLLEAGDSVMADKGFTINELLNNKQASLNIPPFLRNSLNNGQFSPQQVIETQTIASVRIHVERAIRRIKENHLFDSYLPLTLVGSINQLWTVACLLGNFRGPLL